MSAQKETVGRNHLEERDASPITELCIGSVIIGYKFLLLRSFQLQSQEGLSTATPFI